MPRSAIVNGASPLTMIVAGTDPTPMKTKKAVPSASAASFWVIEGSSMTFSWDLGRRRLPCGGRLSRISFDNVECDLDHTLMLRSRQERISAEGGRMIQAVDRALRIPTVLQ